MAAPSAGKHNTSTAPSTEMQVDSTPVANGAGDAWDSERRLVTALAQLQEMEVKIQKLRTLVPTRLWSPLVSVVSEKDDDLCVARPKSPQDLFDQLEQAAREGHEEIEAFKTAWRRPEMQATMKHVEGKYTESGGELPPAVGTWDRDYCLILKQLNAEKLRREVRTKRESEEEERRLLATVDRKWKDMVNSFSSNPTSGLTIRILPSTESNGRFTVLLQSLSIFFFVEQINNLDGQRVDEWHVTMELRPQSTKLEKGVFNCIQSRNRKWDLTYLLNLISSYSNIKTAPCIGCNNLIDSNAQLPFIRKPKLTNPPSATRTFEWEPFHPACVP